MSVPAVHFDETERCDFSLRSPANDPFDAENREIASFLRGRCEIDAGKRALLHSQSQHLKTLAHAALRRSDRYAL